MATQEIFQTCYRGRQSTLHHISYMRMAKASLALSVMEQAGITLENKSYFDYGFGAGTFFRFCPKSAHLFGVEMDPLTVAEVSQMLVARGHRHVRLESIEIDRWEQHPLLHRKYDVIQCSHVLEHLDDPPAFMQRLAQCLDDAGVFLGLVPLNERHSNPHHVHVVDAEKVRDWARASGLEVRCYLEADPWTYWIQPLYAYGSAFTHRLAQFVSLGLGIPATLLGHRLWQSLSKPFGALTFSKPTQAAFVLEKQRELV